MENTFQGESRLPSLPIPDLSETCRKYLNSARPFLTPEEWTETERMVNEFEMGEGKELQDKLVERSRGTKNWLEAWWETGAYLQPRTPIAVLTNIGGPALTDAVWLPKKGSRCARSAMMAYEIVQFYLLLRSETLRVHVYNGKRLSMNQFRSVFSCTRIPEQHVDRIVRHFTTACEGPGQKHVIVMCNGHIYSMNVLSDDDTPLTPPQLQKQLAWIEQQSLCEQGPMVGALTATDRDTWAQARQHIINLSAENAEFLEIIETSLFSLTFSDLCPETQEESALCALTGDARNQWFDKSLTQVCCDNGMFCDNLDHSPADAMIAIVLFDYVTKQLQKRNFEWTVMGSTMVEDLEEPRHLNFVLDSELVDTIGRSLKEYDKLASSLDVRIHVSDMYTKEKARQFPSVRIDSFMQLAIQLTYYKLHQKVAPTYETGMTRIFYHGRTETVRSCTTESTKFVKAMCDSSYTKEDRSRLLIEAGQAHIQLMRDAQSGKGCDRHFFGLQMLAIEEGVRMPELFNSKAWKASGGGGNFVISTSFVGDSPVYGGFSPMVKDGYGVCYAVTSDQLKFIVTSWKTCPNTNAAAFRSGLLESISDFKSLLASAE